MIRYDPFVDALVVGQPTSKACELTPVTAGTKTGVAKASHTVATTTAVMIATRFPVTVPITPQVYAQEKRITLWLETGFQLGTAGWSNVLLGSLTGVFQRPHLIHRNRSLVGLFFFVTFRHFGHVLDVFFGFTMMVGSSGMRFPVS